MWLTSLTYCRALKSVIYTMTRLEMAPISELLPNRQYWCPLEKRIAFLSTNVSIECCHLTGPLWWRIKTIAPFRNVWCMFIDLQVDLLRPIMLATKLLLCKPLVLNSNEYFVISISCDEWFIRRIAIICWGTITCRRVCQMNSKVSIIYGIW